MVTLGLDIGGTKTAALIGGPDGRILGEAAVNTDVSSPEAIAAGAMTAVHNALQGTGLGLSDIRAAGAGVPGQVDPSSGTVHLAVNLNLVSPYPLAAALQDVLGVPVVLENDVRAATLGAFQWLLGIDPTVKPTSSLAYLSIGTGIAAGIMFNGRLYRGAHGMAGEIGHIPVDPSGPRCACGALGCLEAVASGPAIAAYANDVLDETSHRDRLSTYDVFALAAEGDRSAMHVTTRASYFLSRAIYLLVMTYDVEKVILGGGVTHAGDAFRRPLDRAVAELREGSALVAAMLPDDKILMLPGNYNAGAHGAMLLAQEATMAIV